MFLSHFAVGFAAKRLAPAVSLGTLFLSCQLADIIWPNLVLLGIEHVAIAPGNTTVTPLDFISYPYSHSLLMLALWGVLAATLYRWLRGRSAATTSMVVIAGVVLSHWVLDVASHRPDMPIAPGVGAKLGLGLWQSLSGTMVVEFAMLGVGLWIYVQMTQPRDRIGAIALWALVVVLVAMYLGAVLGPPPPSPQVLAWSAEGVWLFVIWGYWIDRHRSPRIAE